MKNFHENTGASIAEIVEFVTKNPARELKIFDLLKFLNFFFCLSVIWFSD